MCVKVCDANDEWRPSELLDFGLQDEPCQCAFHVRFTSYGNVVEYLMGPERVSIQSSKLKRFVIRINESIKSFNATLKGQPINRITN